MNIFKKKSLHFGTKEFHKQYPDWPVIGQTPTLPRKHVNTIIQHKKFKRAFYEFTIPDVPPDGAEEWIVSVTQCKAELTKVCRRFIDIMALDWIIAGGMIRIDSKNHVHHDLLRRDKGPFSHPYYLNGYHIDGGMGRFFVTLYGPGTHYLSGDTEYGSVNINQTQPGDILATFGGQALPYGIPTTTHMAPKHEGLRITMYLMIERGSSYINGE